MKLYLLISEVLVNPIIWIALACAAACIIGTIAYVNHARRRLHNLEHAKEKVERLTAIHAQLVRSHTVDKAKLAIVQEKLRDAHLHYLDLKLIEIDDELREVAQQILIAENPSAPQRSKNLLQTFRDQKTELEASKRHIETMVRGLSGGGAA